MSTTPAAKPSRGQRRKKPAQQTRRSQPTTVVKVQYPRRTNAKSKQSGSARQNGFDRAQRATVRDPKFPKTHSSKVRTLALTMALPHSNKPMRIDFGASAASTAVARPFSLLEADFSNPPTAADAQIAPGHYFCALSRSPLQHVVTWLPNPTNKTYTYSGVWYDPEFDINVTTWHAELTVEPTPITPLYMIDAYSGNSTYLHPHGDIYFPVDCNNRKFVFVNATASQNATIDFTITWGVGLGPASYTLNVWQISGSHAKVRDSYTRAPGGTGETVHLNLVQRGYYSFDILVPTTCIVDIQLQIHASNSCFGILPMNNYYAMHTSILESRTTAASLLLTNKSPELYKSGNVVGVQLRQGVDWFNVCTTSQPYSTIATMQGATSLPAKDGMYAFHKAQGIETYEFINHIMGSRSQTDVISDIQNPIHPSSGWLVMACNIGETTVGAYPGAVFYLTPTAHVEFASSNLWLEYGSPFTSQEDLEAAIHALRPTPAFHENPLHFSDLMNSIGSHFRKAITYAPRLMKALSLFSPMGTTLAPLAEAAAALAERRE